MKRVIGLTGRKYHGKDSAAQVLAGQGYTQFRFADPLKNMLRAFYNTVGLSGAEIERRIEGDLKEIPCPHLRGKTPRFAMQTLGTDWAREMIGDDIWLVALETRIQKTDKAVVSDVRFENEVDTIRRLGGHVWKVDASSRVPSNGFSSHSSEAGIDDLVVDATIDNNGAVEALIEAVCAMNDEMAVR